MRVLVVNAGSSSLKLRLLDSDDAILFHRDLTARHGEFDRGMVQEAITGIRGKVEAVGHRVVHGGTQFVRPVVIDPEVERSLSELVNLAPLHQPKSLAGIDAVRGVLPQIPAVASFDTAFHSTLSSVAATYAVPSRWRELGVRRYGFHGLSHSYASRRAPQLLDRPGPQLRLVICHLGAGASIAAVSGGRSVDTTMGFTPLEGLVMATRSGSIDPGLLIWLVDNAGLSVDAIADSLEHKSGLQALAGSPDMRRVLAAAARGDGQAALAIEVYLHRLRSGISSMAASLGGIDGLVFTGGVGENAPEIRARAADGLSFLGVRIDEQGNGLATSDADVTAPEAPVRTVVVAAREDLQIASEVRSVLT